MLILENIMLCGAIERDEQGSISLKDPIESISVIAVPTHFGGVIHAFITGRGEKGEYPVQIELITPSGVVFRLTNDKGPVVRIAQADPIGSFALNIEMNNVPFLSTGTYTVRCTYQDQSVSATFSVAEEDVKTEFTKEEIDAIIAKPDLVRGVKMGAVCPVCKNEITLVHSLIPNVMRLDEGDIVISDSDELICPHCGKHTFDLRVPRRHMMHAFGKPKVMFDVVRVPRKEDTREKASDTNRAPEATGSPSPADTDGPTESSEPRADCVER